MNISQFDWIYPKNGVTPQPTDISIEDFLNKVKYGEYKTQVEKIRACKDKNQRGQLKKETMPVVCVSGTFTKRGESYLTKHSGFISIDIDDQLDIKGIEKDKYTYACAKSVSGNGYFILVKINPNKHKQSFEWLAEYYYSNYSIAIDQMPSNVASVRYYSYDPDLIINKDSEKAGAKTKPQMEFKPPTILASLGTDDFSNMVNQVVEIGADLTGSYRDWLTIGFALADEFNEGGREYFHTLSSMSPKYSPKVADKKYDECLKNGNGSVKIGTLYYMMKGCGAEFPKVERQPLLFASARLKKGDSKETIKEGIKELYGKSDEQAETIIKTSEKLDLKDLGETEGEVLETLNEWLLLNFELRRNEVTRKVEANGAILTDERLRTICIKARIAFSNKFVKSTTVTEFVFSESIPTYNPIKEFIEKHKDRETNGELQAMIDCIKAKDELHKEIYIRLWLVGIIASAMEGHPMRTILSFMSKQSTGKSYWFENLFPKELKEYSASSDLTKGKDDELLMTEKLMVYKDENTKPSQEMTDKIKQMVSASSFTLRAPYGRMNQTYKRLAVVAITSNWFDIMNDPTGNTRLLPIEVLSIDFNMQNNIDRISLFVEMYREWENGASYELDKDQVAHLSAISEDYAEIDPAKELLQKYFSAPTKEEYASEEKWVTNMTLTEMRIHITNQTNERVDKKNFNFYVNDMFKDQEYKSRHTEHGPRKSYRVVKKQTSEELKFRSY